MLIDCEGYEKQLFNQDNVYAFKNTDILIEIHDFINDSIPAYLLQLFTTTHSLKIIHSISDFQKPYIIDYAQLNNLDYGIKYNLLAEKRPSVMQWFFFKSVS